MSRKLPTFEELKQKVEKDSEDMNYIWDYNDVIELVENCEKIVRSAINKSKCYQDKHDCKTRPHFCHILKGEVNQKLWGEK